MCLSLCHSGDSHSHTVTWTLTPHLLLPACLCVWVAAHSHRRTGALHCVAVWAQRVKECVTVTMSSWQRTQSQSPPSLAAWLLLCTRRAVAVAVRHTRKQCDSVCNAVCDCVALCVTQCVTVTLTVYTNSPVSPMRQLSCTPRCRGCDFVHRGSLVNVTLAVYKVTV